MWEIKKRSLFYHFYYYFTGISLYLVLVIVVNIAISLSFLNSVGMGVILKNKGISVNFYSIKS